MTDDGTDGRTWGPQWDRTTQHIPSAVAEWDQWMAQKDKQPFAPWADTDNPYSWSDPENWTDLATVRDWTEKLTSLEDAYAFLSQTPDDPYDPPADPFLMVDGDDVRDPETGTVIEVFERLLADLGATYCDVSRSGTGVHAYYVGELPEAYTTGVEFALTDDEDGPHVEIYHGKRQYIWTGQHVVGTPETIEPVNSDVLEGIAEAHGTDTSGRGEGEDRDLDVDADAAREVEFTDDFDDILAVIDDLSVHEMRMRSSHTQTRNNGDEDWDPRIPGEPSSKSGTRLSIFDGGTGVYYRKGDHATDALGLVAWEEGIISPGDKLQGDDFWDALQAARERGAPIPKYDAGTVGLNDGSDGRDDHTHDPDPPDPPEAPPDEPHQPGALEDPPAEAPDAPPADAESAQDAGAPPDTDAESAQTDPDPDAEQLDETGSPDTSAGSPSTPGPAHGGGGGDGPPGPGATDPSGVDPAALYIRACEAIHWPTHRIRVVEENGTTHERGVDDVVGPAQTLREAHLLFERNQTELDGTERQRLYQFVLWFGFSNLGEFFVVERGDARTLYYYYEPDAEVLQVDAGGQHTVTNDFRGLVQDVFGISTGQWSRNLLTDLIARAKRHAPVRELHQFATWDAAAGELYVNAYEDRYYAVSASGVEERRNGQDVFFETPSTSAPYEYLAPSDRADLPQDIPGERPMYAGTGDPVMRLVPNRVNYSDTGSALGPMDQRRQLYLHLHTLPFVDMLNSRPIMAWVGEKGSGKTAVQRTIGKWLFGPDFRESSMPDSEEDFTTKLVNKPLAFVDNYDEGKEWANDVLASVATGTGIEMRELYSTASLAEFQPDCWLSLTSRTPPFRRDDVADRLLIFHIDRVDTQGDDFVPEGQFYGQIDEYRDTLWSAYLDNLADVIGQIETTDFDQITTSHRMSDWARLALVVGDALDVPEVDDLLDTMELEQATFALEEDPVGLCVDSWVEDDPDDAATWRTAGDLLDRLQQKREQYATPPLDVNTAAGLGSKLNSTLRSELEELYGLETQQAGRSNEYRFTEGEDDHSATGLGNF